MDLVYSPTIKNYDYYTFLSLCFFITDSFSVYGRLYSKTVRKKLLVLVSVVNTITMVRLFHPGLFARQSNKAGLQILINKEK